jgi:hypothetical protein
MLHVSSEIFLAKPTMSNSFYKILIYIMILSLITILINLSYLNVSFAQMGDGHNMPAASLDDRKAVLIFTTEPSQLIAGKDVDLHFNLTDNKTGNNILHVTYLVTVMKDDERLFTASMHTHDGNMKVLFVPDSANPYKVTANFDVLSASYVSDFGSPIKVNGPIFTTAGNYSVSLEVTGVDFDNLFLPTPLKIDFNIPVKG